MQGWRAFSGLMVIAAAILCASRQRRMASLFQWLPVPLWCYALPMVAVSWHMLPDATAPYRAITEWALPLALGLLLLGIDLRAIVHAGGAALLAAVVGALGVIVGAVLGVWLMRTHLPPDAWQGAGMLAGTWTGGTMNLLAVQTILAAPQSTVAPLIIVDALIAYGWMALLVGASAGRHTINRWLGAADTLPITSSAPLSASHNGRRWWAILLSCIGIATLMVGSARLIGAHLPTSRWISSASGWTVLLVTTAALALSLLPYIRHCGTVGTVLGYPCLYLVLAATGAQASWRALQTAPGWIVVGLIVVLVHGGMLWLVGRCARVPLGILATASQANIGGVVSAPLVGAVYHQSLAPIGLLLAVAGNALGTYLGLCAAMLCRRLLH